jgi:hypothetical protein
VPVTIATTTEKSGVLAEFASEKFDESDRWQLSRCSKGTGASIAIDLLGQ